MKHIRGREAYIGDLFNLILAKLERRQYKLLHPLDEATTILLEAFQELCLDVLLHKKVGVAEPPKLIRLKCANHLHKDNTG